ncbi:hypothetical protein Fmac_006220 [Flemingia macrophylla]|uniref:UDENN domain-containing protein n=1 Tax=Flemingia macrophylla TaxID=520843 RepID=A0ABD1NA31_9FABA
MNMDTKEEGEPQEERPSSPMRVLQQLSEGAFRVAGEAFHNMYSGGGSGVSQMGPGAHRRSQSELVTRGYQRTQSLQKLKSHVNKAWRWGGRSREECMSSFNPEVMANQKRQWYQLHPKTLECVNYKEPTALFEHFVIMGLHPDANLEEVEHSFAIRKKWEKEKGKLEFLDYKVLEQQRPPEPILEPQLLFKYPPAKKLTMRLTDLSSFCFPEEPPSSVTLPPSTASHRRPVDLDRLSERRLTRAVASSSEPPRAAEVSSPYRRVKHTRHLHLLLRSPDPPRTVRRSLPVPNLPSVLELALSSLVFLSSPTLGPCSAWLLERTPSLSELNELVYGQEHLGKDDHSFVFTVKATDNTTLYGVCLHVPEIVQRPPGILGIPSSFSHPSGACSRFLVSAPRCYCLLTRVPFFELHFEMLNSLIAQERLNRITQFVNEMTLASCIPSTTKLDDQMSSNAHSPDRESFGDWMTCAIPLDGAAAITAAAAGIISDDEIVQLSPKIWDSRCQSPVSVTGSDTSDFCQFRDIDKDGRKILQDQDRCAFETPETCDSMERMHGNCKSGQVSPKVGTPLSSQSNNVLDHLGSSESLFSPVRSMTSEDEDDVFTNNERYYGNELLMEQATENKNDLLQIVCRYHAQPIPPRGSEFVFHPLEHLQPIQYIRHSASSLGLNEECLNCPEIAQVNAKLAAAEEALSLSVWTMATTCRVLSLNSGVLSSTVLSLIPMIRPFQWQSLLLPVLPGRMIDFLDAPVPYIVGIQHKPDDMNMKTTNLVLVNAQKDQVTMCPLPKLPQHKELVSQLTPIHAKLSKERSIAKKHPVHRCNEVQAEAATKFLNIMWHYLESLCSDLKSHTITSVQSNNDRVSLLLKDSFIDSFPARDQPFVKLFVDTQLFTVLSDSRLQSFENGGS